MKLMIILAAILAFSLPEMVMSQWTVAPHIVISIPRSDFEKISGTGGGFGVNAHRRFKSLGGIELGGHFAFLSYGKELNSIGRNPFTGLPVIAEFRNEGYRLVFGPRYSFGGDSYKIHLDGMGGLYYYRTNVVAPTVGITDSRDNKVVLGWNLGGGLQFDIGLGPWLDLGFEYQTIYNVKTEVSVPGDESEGIKQEITANEFTIKIGVIFFLK